MNKVHGYHGKVMINDRQGEHNMILCVLLTQIKFGYHLNWKK
jgi:hypothetical protein